MLASASAQQEVQVGALAQDLEADVLARLAGVRAQWVPLAASLYRFHTDRAWVARGMDTFREWLAQPEIGLAYRTAKDMIDAFDELVIERLVPIEELARLDASKVSVVVPALRAGSVDTESALADCKALARSDLRAKYRTGASSALDASLEPARCTCAACGHSHRRKDDR